MGRARHRRASSSPASSPSLPAEAPRGQDLPASLVADQVTYDRETRLLTASGNVEVLYQGRVLRARRIIYDEAADEIRAEGPLVLTDPAGGVLLADAAALTPDLTDGLISSARLLIAGQLQLAAAEVRAPAAATRRSTARSRAPAPSAPRTRRRPGRSAPRASPRTPWRGASTSRTPASSSSACRSATCRG